MNKIQFTVNAAPRTRSKRTGDASNKTYRRLIRQAVTTAMKGAEPFNGAVAVKISFFSHFAPIANRYGNIDNLAATVLDAILGVVFKDHNQITTITATKFKTFDSPRVEVSIEPAAEVISDENFRQLEFDVKRP